MKTDVSLFRTSERMVDTRVLGISVGQESVDYNWSSSVIRKKITADRLENRF